jgi:hypothetical protein
MGVTFQTDGNNSLTALQVMDVQPKNYSTDALPYWGIEKVNSTEYVIADVNHFWGLIDKEYANSQDLEVRRTPSIYLPAGLHYIKFPSFSDSFTAGTAFQAAWETVYRDAGSVVGNSQDFVPRYDLARLVLSTLITRD